MNSRTLVWLLAASFSITVLAADVDKARQDVNKAEQKLNDKQENLRKQKHDALKEMAKKTDSMRRASNIIGADVVNKQGESLGEVKDLVLNLDRSDIAYAVVSAGGVLGVGERWHAVPMASMKLNATRDAFVMNMDKAAWKNAPGFEKDHWPDFGSESWNRENDRYYQ